MYTIPDICVPYAYEYVMPAPCFEDFTEASDTQSEGSDERFSDKEIAKAAVEIALKDERVISARAFCFEGEIFLAALTLPFYLKSERDAFKKALKDEIGNKLEAAVCVTFSMEVYRNAGENLSEDAMRRLSKLAKAD